MKYAVKGIEIKIVYISGTNNKLQPAIRNNVSVIVQNYPFCRQRIMTEVSETHDQHLLLLFKEAANKDPCTFARITSMVHYVKRTNSC